MTELRASATMLVRRLHLLEVGGLTSDPEVVGPLPLSAPDILILTCMRVIPPVLIIAGVILCRSSELFAADDSFFRERVAPLLERHCVQCHQGPRPKGGLSLESGATAKRGATSGPVIDSKGPDSSRIIEVISGNPPEMPPRGQPLSKAEIELLRQWIIKGAVWPEQLKLRDRHLAGADDNWWAFRPLARPVVPNGKSKWPRSPIDAFILAKLEEKKLQPAPEADRRTLIRRLTFDFHGLPPTPDEVSQFLADESPTAYEALVDRLLASRRYGERWARHWLDIVHYGESHGYDKDKPRRNAWPYRDYVIAAFNDDKPYDRFVQEQLAGDVLFPNDPQAVVATGFIAAGPWDFVGHVELQEGKLDKKITRSNDRDDMVSTAMSTFQSLTVHCARCHNHKFDPISQEEYYRLQAVFAGVDRNDRPFDIDPGTHRIRRGLLHELKLLTEKKADAPTREQRDSVLAKIKAVEKQIAALPAPSKVFAATNQFAPFSSFTAAVAPRKVFLLNRGNDADPGPEVSPGALSCLKDLPGSFEIQDLGDEGARRAALAKWITDRRNSLTSRSIVNRVWQYHFGRGIVETPNDFGHQGSLPTHPELLDWLASEFVEPTQAVGSESGKLQPQSIKRLHRLIVTSAVYRQASRHQSDFAAIDSGNQYLWRQNRRRLEAEAIHDATLAVAGTLDLRTGGPSDQQFFFKDDHSPVYDYDRFNLDSPGANRRSIYRFIVRSVPDPFLECLDAADPSLLVPRRNATLTALQALSLLNNRFMARQAEHFAERLKKGSPDLSRQIELAVRLAFGREPQEGEIRDLEQYAKSHGLANTCRVILNSNEFVFVD